MRILLRIFGFFFSVGAIFFVIGTAVLGYFYWKYSQDLPDHAQLANYEPPVMTRVHAADGSLIAEYARERRLYLPIQAMPEARHLGLPVGRGQELLQAFRHRPGGSGPRRRAQPPSGGKREQGASTITQQVAKNFLRRQREELRAQNSRGADRASDGIDLLEGQDPRTLPERDLPRHPDAGPQSARDRRGCARLFRQVGA